MYIPTERDGHQGHTLGYTMKRRRAFAHGAPQPSSRAVVDRSRRRTDHPSETAPLQAFSLVQKKEEVCTYSKYVYAGTVQYSISTHINLVRTGISRQDGNISWLSAEDPLTFLAHASATACRVWLALTLSHLPLSLSHSLPPRVTTLRRHPPRLPSPSTCPCPVILAIPGMEVPPLPAARRLAADAAARAWLLPPPRGPPPPPPPPLTAAALAAAVGVTKSVVLTGGGGCPTGHAVEFQFLVHAVAGIAVAILSSFAKGGLARRGGVAVGGYRRGELERDFLLGVGVGATGGLHTVRSPLAAPRRGSHPQWPLCPRVGPTTIPSYRL